MMEEIQKSLQLYKEQVKFYSDFVINLAKDSMMISCFASVNNTLVLSKRHSSD